MEQVVAPIISNSEVMPRVYLIWLECPQIASQARPGQFVTMRCGEDTMLRRPLSIHQVEGNRLALLFSVVGKGTRWLSQRQAGSKLDLLGPAGNGYVIRPDSGNLLLLAGGIGIAPLCFLAQHALKKGHAVKLLLGASTSNLLYPKHLLPSGVEVILAIEDETAGQKGMITDPLPDYVDWADQIFACGPVAMYQTMADGKQKLLKGKPTQVSLEVRMGCGRGICFSCTVKTKQGLKQVCMDGPVFDLNDVLWDGLNLV
ncbi:dihydroorotate dehydrogenase electron transfer subunit [Chloroflexota bacterium]